jgi:hypothetical protein
MGHGLTRFRLSHGGLQGLADDDHTHYLRVDATRALSDTWDAGAFGIQARRFISDVATGTAPLTVTSTTKVTSLNLDQLDGRELSFLRNAGNVDGGNLAYVRMPSGSDTWASGSLVISGNVTVAGDLFPGGRVQVDGEFRATSTAPLVG